MISFPDFVVDDSATYITSAVKRGDVAYINALLKAPSSAGILATPAECDLAFKASVNLFMRKIQATAVTSSYILRPSHVRPPTTYLRSSTVGQREAFAHLLSQPSLQFASMNHWSVFYKVIDADAAWIVRLLVHDPRFTEIEDMMDTAIYLASTDVISVLLERTTPTAKNIIKAFAGYAKDRLPIARMLLDAVPVSDETCLSLLENTTSLTSSTLSFMKLVLVQPLLTKSSIRHAISFYTTALQTHPVEYRWHSTYKRIKELLDAVL